MLPNDDNGQVIILCYQSPSTTARILSKVYSMKDHSPKHSVLSNQLPYCPEQAPTGTCNKGACNKLGMDTCTEVLHCPEQAPTGTCNILYCPTNYRIVPSKHPRALATNWGWTLAQKSFNVSVQALTPVLYIRLTVVK